MRRDFKVNRWIAAQVFALLMPGLIAYGIFPNMRDAGFSAIDDRIRLSQRTISGYEMTSVLGLYARSATVDLGVVQTDATANATFYLRNFGASALSIEKVAPECGCTTATAPTGTLNPGEEITISAALSTSKVSEGEFEKSIIVSVSGAQIGNRAKLSLRGSVDGSRTFTVFPRVVDFGNVALGSEVIRDVYVRACSGVIRSLPEEIAIGASDEVRIPVVCRELTTDLETKSVRLRLRVSDVRPSVRQLALLWDVSGARQLTSNSSVSYRSCDAVTTTPSRVFLLRVDEMETPSEQIRLHSVGNGSELRIRSVSCDIPVRWKIATDSQDSANATLTVTNDPSPSLERTSSGTLQIVFDRPSALTLKVPIVVSTVRAGRWVKTPDRVK